MNVFAFVGLVFAAVLILIYLWMAMQNGKHPQLNDAVVVCLGAGGIVSALRIIGAVLSGHFIPAHTPSTSESVWSLSAEDATQIVLGSIALAWVSIQTIFLSFKSVRQSLDIVDLPDRQLIDKKAMEGPVE